MKRRTLKSIACAAIMALALSATACGAKDAAKTEDNANVEDAASTEDTTGTDDTADTADTQEAEPTEAPATDETEAGTEDASNAGTGEYTTLEEFYNDPSVKSVLDSAFESMGGEGMALSIEVKENTLTMICKFEDESLDTTGMGEALDAALETQEETFKTQAATFDDTIGQPGACTVVVRYTDAKDNVLTEKEYKAQ